MSQGYAPDTSDISTGTIAADEASRRMSSSLRGCLRSNASMVVNHLHVPISPLGGGG